MDLLPTLSLAASALALALFSGWRGARPPNPARGPRMVPWQFIMMMAGAVLVLMLVHLASLLGARQQG